MKPLESLCNPFGGRWVGVILGSMYSMTRYAIFCSGVK
jgi:hypothetical protein